MKEFKLVYTGLQPRNHLLQWTKPSIAGGLNFLKPSGPLKKQPPTNLTTDEAEVSSPVCYAGKEQFRPGFE
ncbi:hypothetical protein [Adhaeribacter rhizoryzae]|uniref:Uncharacterized protein n=1 Tax=Adhaeribacter rhizoryzae TaxID=2607907 RepID=A0A5M6DQG5_9BACT|nr:hypothetical protein [Adhaeribacter rhizoryzae]KAA5548430.1 hypothetical protein F0145_06805 [Adhaeribacter rhizoryzae]